MQTNTTSYGVNVAGYAGANCTTVSGAFAVGTATGAGTTNIALQVPAGGGAIGTTNIMVSLGGISRGSASNIGVDIGSLTSSGGTNVAIRIAGVGRQCGQHGDSDQHAEYGAERGHPVWQRL